MPTTHTFRVNGQAVRVDVEDDVRLLWVLRDLLGIHGPKYGCGLNVCKACTSHVNGKAFNPCAVQVKDIKPTDEITTIEGLPATVGKDLHPMQQAWIDHDVAQCGYCQPGQIMAAVALVKEAQAAKRAITEDDLDSIRNVCRCGTYYRIREAIQAGAAAMAVGAADPVVTPVTPTTTTTTTASAGTTTKATAKKPTVKKVAVSRPASVPATVTQPKRTLAFTGADPAVVGGGVAAVAAAVAAARLRRSGAAADETEATGGAPAAVPADDAVVSDS